MEKKDKELSSKKKKKKNIDPNFDKEKAKMEMFDPRGVQTLFRTLSRNHYNLLKMVDNKASIILTINSIITSLLMGAMYIAPESERAALQLGGSVLMNFSLISMFFAVLSMLPHRYFGKAYSKSDYKGSLYAASFARFSLEEFQQEFQRIINNGNAVYDEMTKDLYFLGKTILMKQRFVWISALIFIIGIIAAMIISIKNGFHMM